MVPEYYDIANNDRSEEEVGALRQVSVDVPRTAPGVAFFHEAPVQKCLERILYIWGIRFVIICGCWPKMLQTEAQHIAPSSKLQSCQCLYHQSYLEAVLLSA